VGARRVLERGTWKGVGGGGLECLVFWGIGGWRGGGEGEEGGCVMGGGNGLWNGGGGGLRIEGGWWRARILWI